MVPPPNKSLSGTKYQEWTKVSLWKTAFKKFEVIWPAEADYIPLNSLKAVFHKFFHLVLQQLSLANITTIAHLSF